MIEINSFARSTWSKGLGMLYMPDAGTGTATWPDYSGNTNTATLVGTASFVTATGFNSRRVLDVGDSGATITDHSSLDAGSEATICAWVRMTAEGVSGSSYLCDIIGDENSSGYPTICLRVGSSSEANRRRVTVVTRIGANWREFNSNGNIPLNTWTFIVGTIGSNTGKIFFNGSENNSTSFPYTLQNYSHGWIIGKSAVTGSPRLWPGQIGMVGYWPQRALSENEIKALYEATK